MGTSVCVCRCRQTHNVRLAGLMRLQKRWVCNRYQNECVNEKIMRCILIYLLPDSDMFSITQTHFIVTTMILLLRLLRAMISVTLLLLISRAHITKKREKKTITTSTGHIKRKQQASFVPFTETNERMRIIYTHFDGLKF